MESKKLDRFPIEKFQNTLAKSRAISNDYSDEKLEYCRKVAGKTLKKLLLDRHHGLFTKKSEFYDQLSDLWTLVTPRSNSRDTSDNQVGEKRRMTRASAVRTANSAYLGNPVHQPLEFCFRELIDSIALDRLNEELSVKLLNVKCCLHAVTFDAGERSATGYRAIVRSARFSQEVIFIADGMGDVQTPLGPYNKKTTMAIEFIVSFIAKFYLSKKSPSYLVMPKISIYMPLEEDLIEFIDLLYATASYINDWSLELPETIHHNKSKFRGKGFGITTNGIYEQLIFLQLNKCFRFFTLKTELCWPVKIICKHGDTLPEAEAFGIESFLLSDPNNPESWAKVLAADSKKSIRAGYDWMPTPATEIKEMAERWKWEYFSRRSDSLRGLIEIEMLYKNYYKSTSWKFSCGDIFDLCPYTKKEVITAYKNAHPEI